MSDNVKVFMNETLGIIGDHKIDPNEVGNPISVNAGNTTKTATDIGQGAITVLKQAAHEAGFNAVIVVNDVPLISTGTCHTQNRVLTAVAAVRKV